MGKVQAQGTGSHDGSAILGISIIGSLGIAVERMKRRRDRFSLGANMAACHAVAGGLPAMRNSEPTSRKISVVGPFPHDHFE
jgi:hypothetical protein